MADTIKVVGKSIDGSTGKVTFEVPVEDLPGFNERVKTLPSGSVNLHERAIARDLGARYGLKQDEQTLAIPETREARIELAHTIYQTEPVVATAVDIMVDLAMTGMENRSTDAKAKEFFDKFCRHANFDQLHRFMFLEYILSGDVFPMRGNKVKVTFGSDKGFEYFDYTVLNPMFVTVTGTLVGESYSIGIKPNEDLKKLVRQQDDPEVRKLLQQLPPKLKQAAIDNTVWVPPKGTITRVSRKRQPYERYSTPFLTRVFEPVLIKRRMREADLALAETIRSVLVTVTTGSDEFPAQPGDLENLARLFENPSKSMDLFWNHTLKVEYHFPPADLFNATKYEQVNEDILQGLGIPEVLIGVGDTGSFATAWTSMLSLNERLTAIQHEIERWQEAEYAAIAEALKLNFKEIPSVQFRPINLRDDKVFKNMLLELYDRGPLSTETLLSYVDGLNIEVEARNRAAEREAGLEDIFARRESRDKGGRPNDKVDPGNYTDRDKTPDVEDDEPEQPSSNESKVG